LLLIQLKRLLYKGLPNKDKSRQGSVNPGGQYGVRKKGILKEDSFLRLKGIDILYINLGRLIGRKSCTIPDRVYRESRVPQRTA
jgi:hypothetical protein